MEEIRKYGRNPDLMKKRDKVSAPEVQEQPEKSPEEEVAELRERCLKFGETFDAEHAIDIDGHKYVKTCMRNAFEYWINSQPTSDPDLIRAAYFRVRRCPTEELGVLATNPRGGAFGGRSVRKPKAELGNGEMVLEILGSRCEPQVIGRITTESRTIPGNDQERFGKLRQDAFAVEGVVIGGRSFLHDQAPEAHRLIHAMTAFYDAKDDPELLEQRRKELEDVFSELKRIHRQGYAHGDLEDKIFNLENYEKTPKNKDFVDEDEKDKPMIYFLRRIEKNLEPVPLDAPKTQIPELNAAFERLGKVQVDERTGELLI